MLLSLRKNGLTSLFKEVRVFHGPHLHQSSGDGAFCIWMAITECVPRRSQRPSQKLRRAIYGPMPVMGGTFEELPRPSSGHVRPRQGTEICNFGAPSPLEALHWIFCFFSSICVQFSKTSPLNSGESSEKSSGENRVKSCHVCGCSWFFRP